MQEIIHFEIRDSKEMVVEISNIGYRLSSKQRVRRSWGFVWGRGRMPVRGGNLAHACAMTHLDRQACPVLI